MFESSILVVGGHLLGLFCALAAIFYHQPFHEPYLQLSCIAYALVTALALLVVRNIITAIVRPTGHRLARRRFPNVSDKVVSAKADRFSVVAFKFIYFTVSVAVFFPQLMALKWWPSELGGEGGPRGTYDNRYGLFEVCMSSSSTKPEPIIYSLYSLNLGYHLHSFAHHLFGADIVKYEFMLHDVITLFLVLTSNRIGVVRMGVVVMMLFDTGDIFVYASKVFVDTPYRITTYVCYGLLMLSWIPLRIIGLPAIALNAIIQEAGLCLLDVTPTPFSWYVYQYGIFIVISLLWILNLYWYYLLFLMGYSAFKNNEPTDFVGKKIDDAFVKKIEAKKKR